MNKNVVILNFSTRSDGNCAKICDFIGNFYKRTNVCLLKSENQPCGGCNYECLRQDMRCPSMTQKQKNMMEAMLRADVVYFVVPNYCGFPCANYFAFNERSVGYFNRDRSLLERYLAVKKRFVVVSNSVSDNFRNALQQQTDEEPEIFYLKSGKYGKHSIAGDILEADEAVTDLQSFLEQYG